MMSENKGPCGVCRGAYNEHFDEAGKALTQHAYVPEGGSLMTQKEAAEARNAPAQGQRLTMPPGAMYMGNAGMSVGRLVEVMLKHNYISSDEALYVAGMMPTPTGMAPTSNGVQ